MFCLKNNKLETFLFCLVKLKICMFLTLETRTHPLDISNNDLKLVLNQGKNPNKIKKKTLKYKFQVDYQLSAIFFYYFYILFCCFDFSSK